MFCTKNPKPMFSRIDKLKEYRQFWFVTLTPYGKDIEPNVPKKTTVIGSIKQLSSLVGNKSVSYRYDPIFITEIYSMDYHLRAFEKIASELSGYVNSCVISFIDLYGTQTLSLSLYFPFIFGFIIPKIYFNCTTKRKFLLQKAPTS